MKNHFELYSAQKAPELFTTCSRRMIKTLKDCPQIETSYPGKPYGPTNISASFFGLYKRGLLDINTNPEIKLKHGTWYVTTKGLLFLISISNKQTMPNESILLSNIYKLKQKVMILHNSMYNLKLTSEPIIIKYYYYEEDTCS